MLLGHMDTNLVWQDQSPLPLVSLYKHYHTASRLTIVSPVWALCTLAIAYQGIKGRRWWLLATLGAGSFLECCGNAIRIGGHFDSHNVNAYIAQQVILVLTPAFFAAAHFTILVKVCALFDTRYISPFKPKWLIPFFVIVDVASLAVQGAGSGLAATAEINGMDVATVNNKGQIVTAGLAIQLAGYICFNVFFILFVVRANKEANIHAKNWTKSMKTFLLATWISAILVLGRSCFRTAEMSKGWIGEVATTEWYYLVFDATFVALAVIILIVVSPTKYLPRLEDTTSELDMPRTSSDLESSPTTVAGSLHAEKTDL